MRGIVAGLVVGLMIVVVALVVATLGALGIAAIGWLLQRWFDLTQWQGSLIALAVALGTGFAVFRVATVPDTHREPEWIEWNETDEEVAAEPPVVAWRRQRPTQGDLPNERPQRKAPHHK